MKTILVIEDNNEVRENIAEIHELSNYRVLTAPEGKTGVETALKEKPDLIVCDIMMPVLDGYGVLHLLNKHNDTYGTPFIFLTAKSEKSDFRKGMEMGADDYITKPFNSVELVARVKALLRRYTTLGSIPWTLIFVLSGYYLGNNYTKIASIFNMFKLPIIIFLIICVLAYLYIKIIKPKIIFFKLKNKKE